MASAQAPPDENIAWHLYVGTIVTIVPATIAVILRFISRHVARVGLWWDDYTIAIALVSCSSTSHFPSIFEKHNDLLVSCLGNKLGYGNLAMGPNSCLRRRPPCLLSSRWQDTKLFQGNSPRLLLTIRILTPN
jgi:hypothetical protein